MDDDTSRIDDTLRIDKWLWAARFHKTRSLASEAVKGGRVHINGQRAKPSKEVAAGDRVEVLIGHTRRTVIVRGVASRRGPATEAEQLYEETAESRAERERLAAERRLAQPPGAQFGERPTKRDRRRYEQTPGTRRGRR